MAAFTKTTWSEISFRKLKLLGQQMSFTIDYSKVECGCNGAVYLVNMPEVSEEITTSGYCDIQGYEEASKVPPCIELDLIEGNAKAVQSTLHTRKGHGIDGACNQDGCLGSWGKESNTSSADVLYGRLVGRERTRLVLSTQDDLSLFMRDFGDGGWGAV